MTIKINNEKEKTVLDLNGPDGNAMVLISTGARILKILGAESDDIDNFKKKMFQSNYNQIVKYIDQEFSDYVDLKMNEDLYKSIFIDVQEFS